MLTGATQSSEKRIEKGKKRVVYSFGCVLGTFEVLSKWLGDGAEGGEEELANLGRFTET